MAVRLVQLSSHNSPAEAEVVVRWLTGLDVQAVTVEEPMATLGLQINATIGRTRVMVDARDLERARRLYAEFEEGNRKADERGELTAADAWLCEACGEQNGAEFDLCWSCGAEYTPAAKTVRASDRFANDPADIAPELDAWTCDTCGQSYPAAQSACLSCNPEHGDPANPYRSPLAVSAPVRQAPIDSEFESEADRQVHRAWRAAIIGLVLLPPILHIYSLYLLLAAGTKSDTLNPSQNWRYNLTLAIDLLMLMAAAIVGKAIWTSPTL